MSTVVRIVTQSLSTAGVMPYSCNQLSTSETALLEGAV